MKKIYTDYLIRLKEIAKVSFETMQDALGISASTLCRYFKGDAEPTVDTLERIVEYLGGNMRDLYAQIGEQEMKDSEKVDYKGATALLEDLHRHEAMYKEHCDLRVAHAEELYKHLQDSFDASIATLERSHAAALLKRDETYDRTAKYLKEQVLDLKQDNKNLLERASKAEAARDQLDARRHHVFWGMLSIILFLSVALVTYIVIDAPQIGAGW